MSARSMWYLAELVMEITVTGSSKNVVHLNLKLLCATSAEKAYKKAMRIGKDSETSYKNPKGRKVKIKFRGISKLEEIYDEIEDKAELRFDEYIGVAQEKIRNWLSPKKSLEVFTKPCPGKERDPDYRSAEVVLMATKRSSSE